MLGWECERMSEREYAPVSTHQGVCECVITCVCTRLCVKSMNEV